MYLCWKVTQHMCYCVVCSYRAGGKSGGKLGGKYAHILSQKESILDPLSSVRVQLAPLARAKTFFDPDKLEVLL